MSDRIIIKFTRFAISGTCAAIIYSIEFTALSKLGIAAWICGAVSYAGTMPFGYMLHRKYSFRSKNPVKQEIKQFAAGSLLGLIFASSTSSALTLTTSMSHAWIAFWTCISTPCITYLIMSILVFNKNKTTI